MMSDSLLIQQIRDSSLPQFKKDELIKMVISEGATPDVEAAINAISPDILSMPCPFCKGKILRTAKKCKHCGEWVSKTDRTLWGIKRSYLDLLGVAIVVLVIFCGLFRVYIGGGVGLRVLLKDGFSFNDTIVNLNDIFGMPRVAVAAQHPAVKRQMERMGWIRSDEDIMQEEKRRIEREVDDLLNNRF